VIVIIKSGLIGQDIVTSQERYIAKNAQIKNGKKDTFILFFSETIEKNKKG
jgi:predicted SnoaL-like aldol condensation-catalyzing enzyme